VVVGVLAAAPVLAAEQHGAHQHGVAALQVSLDGGALAIALDGPAENILGFEHAPKTDPQRRTVARAEEQLKRPENLFSLPATAECMAQPARVEMKLPPPGSKETHSEIEAEWRWQCARPAALTHVDVGLFKVFPRLKELKVQIVAAQGQRAAVLKPKAARLKLGV
jgi:hypothetical protein